jgi:hypothetical protein
MDLDVALRGDASVSVRGASDLRIEGDAKYLAWSVGKRADRVALDDVLHYRVDRGQRRWFGSDPLKDGPLAVNT